MLIDLYTLKRIYAFQRIILFINFNVCIFSVLYDHTKTYILEETLLSFTQLQHFISPDLTCDEPLLNGTNPVPDSYFTALSEKQPAIQPTWLVWMDVAATGLPRTLKKIPFHQHFTCRWVAYVRHFFLFHTVQNFTSAYNIYCAIISTRRNLRTFVLKINHRQTGTYDVSIASYGELTSEIVHISNIMWLCRSVMDSLIFSLILK